MNIEALLSAKNMKMAVIGCRDFNNKILLNEVLFKILATYDVRILVSGGRRKDGKGVDTLVEDWADTNNFPKLIFPADWDKYGKAAGPIRNDQIAEASWFCLAFWNNKSAGTLDCLNRFVALEKIIFVYDLTDGSRRLTIAKKPL